MKPYNMNELVGTHDIVFITLDTLRFDVADKMFESGGTPNFAKLFTDGWEERHSPGSFTYAAHHAFFAGFLPTPADKEVNQERLFATEFIGSTTAGENTKSFKQATFVEGLAEEGYHTVCIGGVGFFNKRTPLAKVLPNMFDESHWSEELGVTEKKSTEYQFELAATIASRHVEPLFLFINVSAIHQPNCYYSSKYTEDNLETHAEALTYVDSQLPILVNAMARRERNTFYIISSDHGTLYGEDGRSGHRVGHKNVYTVPYANTVI